MQLTQHTHKQTNVTLIWQRVPTSLLPCFFSHIDIYVFINIDLKMTTCRWSQLAEEGSEGEDKLDEEEEDKENLVRNV